MLVGPHSTASERRLRESEGRERERGMEREREAKGQQRSKEEEEKWIVEEDGEEANGRRSDRLERKGEWDGKRQV